MVDAARGEENRSNTDSASAPFPPAPPPSAPCSRPSTSSTSLEAGEEVPESDRTRAGPAPLSSALRALGPHPRAQHELLDEVLVVRAQALEDGDERPVRLARDQFRRRDGQAQQPQVGPD
ncbi:hypothetical protein [Streptomyces sp. GZWMJZ-114]|uniref:hypothetical protein n=1 Tax=Streptomyces sp. GZWMJZ-114 TaxID=2494734 RepID=UPI001F510B11|nr:hypothetical protein [Streptomyces sp. GZWMJZ-114]